jgi:hypothetical protein
MLLEFLFVSGGDGNGVEYGVNCHSGKLLLLSQRNAELLKSA